MAWILAVLVLQEETITVVTYNILGEEHEKKKRGEAIVKILEETDADVLALQEVVPWFVAMLGPLAKKYPNAAEAPGGQYLLSKKPFEKTRVVKLSGKQKRTALVATLRSGPAIATMHLESPLEDSKTRAKQLDEIFAALRDCEDAILLGDFNFGDEDRLETERLDRSYSDVWRELRKGETGFTYDLEANPLARKGAFPRETSRRIDRILVKSAKWKAKKVERIGTEQIEKGLHPSDHFGLVGVLSRG